MCDLKSKNYNHADKFDHVNDIFLSYHKTTPSISDAPELSSARIQLELEAFQLGSARLVGF